MSQKKKPIQTVTRNTISKKMENIKLYGVAVMADYEGGGIVAIFSNLEKAKDYADRYVLSCNESIELLSMIVDDPDKAEDCDYYRRG